LPNRLSLLRVLAAMALLVASVAFTACGGDDGPSKDTYKEEAQKISDKFDTDFESSLKNATSEDPQESLTGVKQIAASAGEAADGLEELDTPEDYKDVSGKLVGSLRTLEERGAAVEKAAEAEDEAAITSAVESFQQGIQELEPVGNEFDKKVGTT